MKRLVVLLSILALSVTGVALGATGGKKTSGVAYLTPTHVVNGDLFVSGDVKDKLLGQGALVYLVRANPSSTPGTFNITAKKVTLYTPKGSLSGTGSGVQVVHDDGSVEVRDGKVSLTKGTGKLRGHSFRAKFAGPQKDGVYKFSYTGTYK